MPLGSTATLVLPCVSAMVLFPTDTVVISGNPVWRWNVPLAEIPYGNSYTLDNRSENGTSLPLTPRR